MPDGGERGAGIDYRLHPNLRRLAGHGYPVVAARLRGVAPSPGQGGLYERYGQDGYDLVEWAGVAWQGPGLGQHPFTVTVHAGPARASYAEIPFIGDDPGI